MDSGSDPIPNGTSVCVEQYWMMMMVIIYFFSINVFQKVRKRWERKSQAWTTGI